MIHETVYPVEESPTIAGLSVKFKKALSERKLPYFECKKCNHKFPFPRTRCVTCSSGEISIEFARGTGVIEAYTVLYRSPVPGVQTPFVVAIVKLDEGVKVYSNVAFAENISVGTRVTLDFVDSAGNGPQPIFFLKH